MDSLIEEVKKYHIMCLITVRGCGSHGPRCLWDICGKPMIRWVLEAVKGSPYLDKIVVTTEDKKIKKAVEKIGVQVVDRSLDTAVDQARDYTRGRDKVEKPRSLMHWREKPTLMAERYAIRCLQREEGYKPDLLVGVEANRPLATTRTLNRVIETFFLDKEATQSATFYQFPGFPFAMNSSVNRIFHLSDETLDRQKAFPLYLQGPFHIKGLSARAFIHTKAIAHVFISPEEGLEVHNADDLFLARCHIKRRLKEQGKEVKWEIGQKGKIEKSREFMARPADGENPSDNWDAAYGNAEEVYRFLVEPDE